MKPVTGHTGLTALLGSPVSHSISPLMHNEAFRLLDLDYIYLCFDVNEAQLEDAVRGLTACGIRGFNLTMPDKNRMAELSDELSPAASLIGAVNTVSVENGKLIGHNTDGAGFMRSVEDAGFHIISETITLLGGGGAATAIAAQAALDGVSKIHIFTRPESRFHSRTVNLADNINRTLPCRVCLHDLSDLSSLKSAVSESIMLVNATSAGMAPDTDACPVSDFSVFREGLIVSDIIYNPRETRLLKEAKKAGCRTFNGMYMLLYQGAEAFRIWTGQEMPVAQIKQKFFS